MLIQLKNASNSLAIKIIFGVIICSFCMWGLGDIIKYYTTSKPVIRIGEFKITADGFLKEYNSEVQRIKNDSNVPLTKSDIRKLNIKEHVVDSITQQLVMAEAARRIGVVVPKRTIVESIQSDPIFRRDGVFSEAVYMRALQNANISEAELAAQVGDEIRRMQILHPLVMSYRIPRFVCEMVGGEFESKRTILIARIKVTDMPTGKAPDEEILKTYFKVNAEKYKTPETRDIAILVIDNKDLVGELEIDHAEIKQFYESNKDQYEHKKPETRDFKRFAFDTQEEAYKAWEMLNRGVSINEVARKFATKPSDVHEAHISDFQGELGYELFKLKLSEASRAILISGKYYVYQVAKINTTKQLGTDEIMAKAREDLRKEKMNSVEFYEKIKSVRNKIEDRFGAGVSIDDIAKETNLSIVEFTGLKRDAEADKKLAELVKDKETRTEIFDAAFTVEAQQVSQNIESKETDTISYVVCVRQVKKSNTPPYEKLANKIRADYVFEQQDKVANERVHKIVCKEAMAAKEMAKMRGTKQFKVSKRDLMRKVTKEDRGHEILQEIANPDVVLNAISSLKKGEAMQFKSPDKSDEYIIIAAADVEKDAKPSKEFGDAIVKYVNMGAASDIAIVTVESFKKQLPVEVKKKSIEAILEREEQNEEEG